MLTDNPDHVLLDPEIDIVVETMGGIETARQAITRALENGKFVVTANKDLMAHHGVELLSIAKTQGRSIFYEASWWWYPLNSALKYCLAANRIKSLWALLTDD